MTSNTEQENVCQPDHERLPEKQVYVAPVLQHYEAPKLQKHDHYRTLTLLPPASVAVV